MERSAPTEEHVIAILRELEAGVALAGMCRRHGVGFAAFYNWETPFGGLNLSES